MAQAKRPDTKAKRPHIKRKNSAPSHRVTRGWPLCQAQRINEALEHACAVQSVKAYETVDRFVTELGDFIPECLLPEEYGERVAALKLKPFVPDVWRIIGAYSGNHLEAVNAHVEKFTFTRIICLYEMNRASDALTLAEPLWEHFRSDDGSQWREVRMNWSDLALDLLLTRRYGEAEHLYKKFFTLGANYEWYALYGLCLMFQGRVDEVGAALNAADVLLPAWRGPCLWHSFTQIMLEFPSDREVCARKFEYMCGDLGQVQKDDPFISVLCTVIITHEPFPAKFDAEWLRARHEEAYAKYGYTPELLYPSIYENDISSLAAFKPFFETKRIKS